MDTIQLPDQPILLNDPTDLQIAERIDIAANLIEAYGLEVGDYWSNGVVMPWQDGSSCCTVGAVSVAVGYRRGIDVDRAVVGIGCWNADLSEWIEPDRHPVLARLMWEMCCTEIEQLFDWSDSARPDQVVARLRQVAASLRINAAVSA